MKLKFSLIATFFLAQFAHALSIEPVYTQNGNTYDIFAGDPHLYPEIINAFDDEELINQSDNTINIDLGSESFRENIYGGVKIDGEVKNNTINFKSGTVDEIAGGYSDQGNVSHNTINILGGKVISSVYGGVSKNSYATNNTVNFIAGEVTDSIYGGMSFMGGYSNADTATKGNTLNIGLPSNPVSSTLKARNIYNFEFVNFYIADNVANGTNILYLNESTGSIDLRESKVVVHFNPNNLNDGDIINIIKTTDSFYTSQPILKIGALSLHNDQLWNIYNRGLDLNFSKATLNASTATADEETKTFLESKLTQSIMVNESANNLSENMDNISNIVATNSVAGVDLSSFAFAGVGTKKYKTGSSIDQKALSINAGIAKDFEFDWSGDFLGGLFLEFGFSKYESKLDNGFTNEGDAKFFGIGAFSKKMFKNDFYGIIGARIGQAMNSYDDQIGGTKYNFDFSSLYFGANLGAGKLINLTDSNTLDVYTKYFFVHTNADENEAGGIKIEFDAVNSHQITLGAKDNIAFDEKNKIYALADVNYKFGGESTGAIKSGVFTADIPSPALKGTYFGLGAGYERSQTKSLNLSISAKAYLGKEQGVGLNLGAEYKF